MSTKRKNESEANRRGAWAFSREVIMSHVSLDWLSGSNPVASDLLAPEVSSGDEKP